MARFKFTGAVKWICICLCIFVVVSCLKHILSQRDNESAFTLRVSLMNFPTYFQQNSSNVIPIRPASLPRDYTSSRPDTDAPKGDETINVTPSDASECDSVMQKHNISKTNFVMSLSYWEQLTMATNSLCGLVNFARSWKSRVVLPFTLNAEFYGLPSTVNFPSITGTPPIYKKGPTKSIDMLYDIETFNSDLLCKQYSLPPLVSFNEFISSANRQLIILHINFFDVPPKSLFTGGKSCVDCHQHSQIKSVSYKLLNNLNAETSKRHLSPFKLHSACCLNHMHVIDSPVEIAKACGFGHLDGITLVFTVWRGYSNIPTKKFRLITSNSPLFNKPSPSKDPYPLSQSVINNATAFVKYLSSCSSSSSQEFVSVHLRTAKVAMMGGNAGRRFRSCLDKTQTLLESLDNDCNSFETKCGEKSCYRYFVDYGTFGSHSYEVSLGKKASFGILKQRHIAPVYYNPNKYGGRADQGFVALVEQLSMAHSSVLVLVGGGSFQDQILRRFTQVGRGWRVYRVCHSKEELVELVYEK